VPYRSVSWRPTPISRSCSRWYSSIGRTPVGSRDGSDLMQRSCRRVDRLEGITLEFSFHYKSPSRLCRPIVGSSICECSTWCYLCQCAATTQNRSSDQAPGKRPVWTGKSASSSANRNHCRPVTPLGQSVVITRTIFEIAPCDCTCECWGNVGIPQDMRQAPNRRAFPTLSHRINVLIPIS
jgi:hypothetical protein